MNFALFLLLNAILLIRPEELFPDIAGLRLYLVVIIACVLTTIVQIIDVFRPSELANRPITVCVLGLLCAGILSQMMRGQFGLAFDFAAEFGKVILYYLLLISVVDSTERLRQFLGWIVAFVIVITIFGLLQYHDVIDYEALRPLERFVGNSESDDPDVIFQLRGTGIYNDPNDLCLLLVTGSLASLARSVTSVGLLGRILWLFPIGLFGYAVTLTQSRGGLLGLFVAFLVWMCGRFGWKKTALIAIAGIPVMFFLASGRQGNMSMGKDDTGYQRVELWYEGFMAMMRNPVTGIGVGEYADEMGLVAHNSFVHAYVELGIIGGAFFLSAFCLSMLGILRNQTFGARQIVRLKPFVLAIIVGYAVGIFSISRDYVVPTYIILGLAEVYLQLLFDDSTPNLLRISWRLIGWFILVGVAGLLALLAITRALLSIG